MPARLTLTPHAEGKQVPNCVFHRCRRRLLWKSLPAHLSPWSDYKGGPVRSGPRTIRQSYGQLTRSRSKLGSGANSRVAGDDEKMQRFVPIEDLFQGRHFDGQIIILCVAWYTSFKLSLRDLVIMMADCGISVT